MAFCCCCRVRRHALRSCCTWCPASSSLSRNRSIITVSTLPMRQINPIWYHTIHFFNTLYAPLCNKMNRLRLAHHQHHFILTICIYEIILALIVVFKCIQSGVMLIEFQVYTIDVPVPHAMKVCGNKSDILLVHVTCRSLRCGGKLSVFHQKRPALIFFFCPMEWDRESRIITNKRTAYSS